MSLRAKSGRDRLNPELGYTWDAPPPPTPLQHPPYWEWHELDPVVDMTEELVEVEWPVAGLRRHIRALGVQPKGRSRQDLAEQLAEHFLDADRLARSVAELSDDDRSSYAYLLLEGNLQSLYVLPQPQGLSRRTLTPTSGLIERLVSLGLILTGEQGIFLPYGLRRRLPPLFVPFSQSTEAESHTVAADPRDLLSQIQQVLGLLQSETAELRDVVRWEAPPYPYAAQVTCWPPDPEDARKLAEYPQRQMKMRLRPRKPALKDESLDTWTQAIGASTERVEFLYHLMVDIGLIWSGSPVTVDHDRAQAWMSLPPGRQLGVIYRLSRTIASWSTWWPLWRRGDVTVRRMYYGYWSLMSLDDALHGATQTFRWALLEVLSYLPHDQWIAVADIAAWLEALFPTPESHQYLSGLDLQYRDGRWPGFLRAALNALLSGPLHAMGLVDIAPSLDKIALVRLKGLQGLHWGRVGEIDLEVAGELRQEAVRFDAKEQALEITTPVPPDLMNCVVKWAEPSGLSRNLIRYRLDVERLHRAFEAGEDPDTLSRLWEACAGFEPLPEVKDWWRYWWSRYGKVRLYAAQALLQTRDAFTMQELQVALPSLQASVLGLLTPEAALLKGEDVDRVRENLERQGYMPKEVS
ncbi:MAG: hypothetical protein ACP5JG_13170 [Anaerolineae bacterium]